MHRHVFSKNRRRVPPLLLLLALAGCNSEKAGTTANISVLHHATRDAQGNIPDNRDPAKRVFTNNLGYQVTLTRGYFVIAAVELLPVVPVGGEAFSLSLLGFLCPTAAAHSTASPTRLGTPNVIDLLAADLTPRELGHLDPPPGTYPVLLITWGPADDDAGFLPADVDMVDHTFHLAGTAARGADTLAFTVESSFLDSLEVAFVDSHAPGRLQPKGVVAGQLQLGAGEQVTVGIGMIYDTWFNGVDFKTMDAAAVRGQVERNIYNAIGYHALDGSHHHAPEGPPTRP